MSTEVLVIRYDPAESVLRSVGAPPNGIVCVACMGGVATWVIDGGYQPRRELVGVPGVHLDHQETETGLGPDSTPVDPGDLTAGCASGHEAILLTQGIAVALGHAAQIAGTTLNYEYLQAHVDLAVATRSALAEHGYLRPPEAS